MNILEKYTATRKKTVEFCRHLAPEDYSIQVVKFASPPKWHLAHTTWFFETFILTPNLKDYTVYNSNFNFCPALNGAPCSSASGDGGGVVVVNRMT